MSDLRCEAGAATPPCPHFGVCGGCQLQDLTYAAQLERKAASLRELLGGFALPELRIHSSPPLWYRNRIRLTLREVDGVLRAGYLGDPEDEDGTGRGLKFVPIAQCPIAAPLLWRAAEAFLALTKGVPWLRPSLFTPDQLELFTSGDESRLQLTLFVRTVQRNLPVRLAADFSTFCESLLAHIPELAGAGVALLPAAARRRRVEQSRPGPAWGAPGLNYAIDFEKQTQHLEPVSYWVPRGAFFQVNRFLLPELLNMVTAAAEAQAHQNALVWDLYAGIGLFSRALARKFAQVTAVEIAEPAATALAQAKVENLHAVKATALDFLRAAAVQRERPAVIVLDPPRAGLGSELCDLLARMGAPKLVYVSCSPHALAQDLSSLIANGYAMRELHLFDLFPQTEHIETVAVLDRS